jgi:methyl-accepting chemotaxis protein
MRMDKPLIGNRYSVFYACYSSLQFAAILAAALQKNQSGECCMLNNIKITARISLGFAILMLLLLLLALGGAWGERAVEADLQTLSSDVQSAMNGDQISITMLQLRRFEKDMMLNLGKPEKVAEYEQKWHKASDAMQQQMVQSKGIADAEEQKQLAQIEQLYAAYREGFSKVAKAASAGEYASAGDMNAAMAPFKTPIHELEKAAEAYVAEQHEHQQTSRSHIVSVMAQLRNIGLSVVVLALLLGGIAAWLVTTSISRPLHLMESEITQAVDRRDLTRQVNYSGKDELGSAVGAINRFFAGVRELVNSAQGGCSQLNDTAGELRHVAEEQNRAISYQSEATASTAAAIEQLTVSIGHVADTANDVERESRQSQQLATDGRSLAVQTAGEINRIADSIRQSSEVIASLEKRSQEIGGIVHVIKDIANQTNLLALNAAIEAARAGEQGRGFAVVADEVRKLAENTTHATNQISGMIAAVQQDTNSAVATMSEASNTVTQGVALTQQVADALDNINQMATQSAEKIGGIAESIAEQGAASTQIAQNIEKIAQMSEENSAATAHLADLAQNLNQLSDTLGATIKSYQA